VFEKDLTIKGKAADEKLKLMLVEQKEAEQQKELSIKTKQELDKQSIQISKRQIEVEKDLGKAKPALEAAEEMVGNIQKSHLDEMRAMANPPDPVRIALQAVIVMISDQPKVVTEWNEVKQWLRKDNFISLVKNFDKDNIRT
jgi:dynein heavy chain 1